MPTAYSYIRFSSAEQGRGDSHRRQLEKSVNYALAHGLTLDDRLTFADLGKSAFRGKHASEGELGLFLTAIDEGRVAKDSYLLVENLDRLSRQPVMEALNLLQSIVDRGITLVTLVDGRRYTKQTMHNDFMSLMVTIVSMFRAHDESKVKSERVRAAWESKKKQAAVDGKPITKMCPAWLAVNESAFVIIPENAAAIKRVFDLATIDGLGQRAIMTRMNKEAIPTFGKTSRWTETSIRRILLNPAVIGIYQPMSNDVSDPTVKTQAGEPIENFYPAVITASQFYDAQRLRTQSIIPRGPRGEGVRTIFTGLVFCGHCGGTMRRKGASRNDTMDRLRCSNSCGSKTWKYKPVETAVLMLMASELMPEVDASKSEMARLQAEVAYKVAERDKCRAAIRNLTNAITEGGNLHSLLDALKLAEQKESRAATEAKEAEEQLWFHQERVATTSYRVQSISDMAKTLRDDDSGMIREKLRHIVRRCVDKIVLEDSQTKRTIRLEVGNEVRYIDFSIQDKTFCLRGAEAETTSAVGMKTSGGEMKYMIP